MKLKRIELIKHGKVRDIYRMDEDRLLIVATDRISAFDHVLKQPVPDKGRLLNLLSLFWFNFVKDSVHTHIISSDLDLIKDLTNEEEKEYLRDRFIIVKKVDILPFEFIVRGYLTGSYYKMYRDDYDNLPVSLPKGLGKNSQLPEIILTPTTKSTEKDEPVTPREVMRSIGEDNYRYISDISCRLFLQAKHYLENKGFILVDTKFEFGIRDDEIYLADEIFTPDSSRYWKKEDYESGKEPDSYDKQVVRDYLESTGWDKKSAPPDLPDGIIEKAFNRYRTIYEIITEKKFGE